MLEKFAKFGNKVNKNLSPANVKDKLVWGGVDHLLNAEQFLGIKISLSVILPGVYTILSLISESFGFDGVLWLILLALSGYLFPDFWLRHKVKTRKEKIEQELPAVLDILSVSSNAGLGFIEAIKKMVEKTNGVLSEEFEQVLYDMQMGEPRDEVLDQLAYRCNVEDIQKFVNAIKQSEKFGTSISSVLESQAKVMKNKLKTRTEEHVNKAPVKLILPLVFFVLPSILLVLLGPAILQVAKVFG
mgnify:CR=1 FL=1